MLQAIASIIYVLHVLLYLAWGSTMIVNPAALLGGLMNIPTDSAVYDKRTDGCAMTTLYMRVAGALMVTICLVSALCVDRNSLASGLVALPSVVMAASFSKGLLDDAERASIRDAQGTLLALNAALVGLTALRLVIVILTGSAGDASAASDRKKK